MIFHGVDALIDIITGEVAFSTTIFAVVMIAGILLLCGILLWHSPSGKP